MHQSQIYFKCVSLHPLYFALLTSVPLESPPTIVGGYGYLHCVALSVPSGSITVTWSLFRHASNCI